MTPRITIRDVRGERQVGPDELPLSLGGEASTIVLPGTGPGEPLAWVGMSEQDLFLQVGDRDEPVSCNGVPVATSQWLRDGDTLRLGGAAVTVAIDSDGIRLSVEARADEQPTPTPIEVATVAPPGSGDQTAPATIEPVPFQPRHLAGSIRRHRRLRPGAVAGAALLVVLGVAGWFLFTSHAVEVRIDPAPDQVELLGGFTAIRLGDRYLLRPGTYTVIAEKKGYRRLEATLEVGGGRALSSSFTMEKLPGLLQVDTGSVRGAKVSIDGEKAGVTPLEPLELAPGEHEVLVEAPRFLDFKTRVSIEGSGSSQTLAVQLVPGWGAVSFSSKPSGAEVLADGKSVGVTPVTVDLDPGTHTIEYRLKGHKAYRDTVKVAADRTRTLPAVRLAPADGKLSVKSTPTGATVTVDGMYRGETPIDLHLAPGEPHVIHLSKAGHDPERREITLEPGQAQALRVTLAAREGEIRIAATPSDALLYVNDEPRGTAKGMLRLPAAPQRIEIRKEGFEPYRTTLTPKPGYPQTLEVALAPRAAPVPEAPPKVIQTPQGLDMVLVEPGRFKMGASRREPGRRANETLREVEITRPFYLSTREISNAEYHAFDSEHSSGIGGNVSLDLDDRPVVRVTWEDAALYCNWLSEQASLPPFYARRGEKVVAVRPMTNGYRLPLEAEWAWAARYHDGPRPLKYPWGQSLPLPPASGNFADASARGLLSRVLPGYKDPFPATAPVGSMRPNGLGLFNMGDNVAEWVHDYYSIYPSSRQGVQKDPTGPEDGSLHVIRGASWMDASISRLRLTYRDYGSKARPDVGFRVARWVK
ncbi:MAG: PEGA domain-containing protein [Acidobacteriota bacterium]